MALIAAILRRGDERAFERLYDRYTPALYAFAVKLAGGHEPDAEEIVHDTWVRAAERLGRFEQRSTLKSWLMGIAVNRYRELARAGARDAGPPIEDLAIGGEDAALGGVIDRIDLERAIGTLPPGGREIFLLHDVEGYTHEEIAGMLGIDPGTSKSQLSRARRILRHALEPGANHA